ncbi:MAG TPA: transglycosylase SLT domain-containing protein [Trebonia sp.]|jgi:hypothetical protein|nr:transglycosylase SLT domain-containing protein [Trebonia sp.]
MRRTGIVLPAAAIAAVIVAAVTVAADLVSPNGSGAPSLAEALDQLPQSKSISLLEQEEQQIITMDAAASTLTVAAKPAVVSPAQVEQQASQASQAQQQEQAQQQDTTVAAAPDPGSAQAYAYAELPAFGFSQSGQWSCLEDLWMQESSWQYDAYNPSGAYGIPQALPASKMASAGSDYMTDPDTQIRWGLTYITQVYGTPCGAWDHEVADGWY